MRPLELIGKVKTGLPYLEKEIRSAVSEKTPFFVSKPSMVHLLGYAPCNGRCIFCPWGFDEKGHSSGPNDYSLNRHIPDILHQIAELSGSGTVVSFVPTGEPLLIPELLDWVSLAGELGLDFRFTTNGYLLDGEMARRIVASNPFNVGISLESIDPAINETIRPHKNGTAKTMKAIDLLLSEKAEHHSRITVNIKCTLTRVNLPYIADVVRKYGKERGVLITPQPFEVLSGMPREVVEKLFIRDLSQFEKLLEELMEMKDGGCHLNMERSSIADFVRLYRDNPDAGYAITDKKVLGDGRKRCTIGNSTIFISHDGELHLCLLQPPIGNVICDGFPLRTIWYGKSATGIRNNIRNCKTLCNLSCLRQKSLGHKIKSFLKM